MERNQISSLTATSRSIFCLLHSIHRFIAYCAVRFRLQEHFHCRKFFNHMEPSRKRDRREYQMGRYDAKKQKCMEKKREKMERYMIKIREDRLLRKVMLERDWRKKWWRDGGDGEGYFVIATNVSAVHCALQLQPAYTCLLWTLHYPSMPWSFRDRIIFFAVNGNY